MVAAIVVQPLQFIACLTGWEGGRLGCSGQAGPPPPGHDVINKHFVIENISSPVTALPGLLSSAMIIIFLCPATVCSVLLHK